MLLQAKPNLLDYFGGIPLFDPKASTEDIVVQLA